MIPPTEKPFENIVGKGENAGNQHFLLFLQWFLPFQKQISNFQSCLFCRLLSIRTGLKFCRLVTSSLNDKIFDTIKSNAQSHADEKLTLTKISTSHFHNNRNNCCQCIFSCSHNVFKRLIYVGHLPVP